MKFFCCQSKLMHIIDLNYMNRNLYKYEMKSFSISNNKSRVSKMMLHVFIPFCCLCLLFEECWTLKCRTGNQQINEEFRKVMQNCRRQNSSSRRTGDFSNESNSDESDSDEDLFDKKFLSGNKRKNITSSYNGSGSNNRFDTKNNRQNWNRQSNFKANDMKDKQNAKNKMIFQNDRHNKGDNDNDQQEYAVDQRGFPESNSVTGVMTENIQDPRLRDFVEESITECFHYLRTDMNQNKCKFSQNLLSCLADKGSERCDDWDD